MRQKISALCLTAAVVAAVLPDPAHAAKAKNLFEALFPKLIEQRLEREAARKRALAPPVVAKKISAPKTYTYRVEKAVAITLPAVEIVEEAAISSEPVPVIEVASETQASETTATETIATETLSSPSTGASAAVVETAIVQTVSDTSDDLAKPVSSESVAAEPAASNQADSVAVPPQEPTVEQAVAASETVGSVETAKPEAAAQTLTPFEKDVAIAEDVLIKDHAPQAEAISKHYAAEPDYLWLNEEGQPNARARSALKVLANADEYGLRPEDYSVGFAAGDATLGDAEQAAARLRFELSMTRAVLRYAKDSRFGRVNPNRLSGYHDFPDRSKDVSSLLDELTAGGLPANLLPRFHPSNERFAALKNELAELRGQEDDSINLDPDILLKPGVEDERLASVVDAIKKRGSKALLEAHAETLGAYDGGPVYSDGLMALVKAYQKEAGLGADGIVGRRTIAKLTGVGPLQKIERVTLAMERLRWLPHELGSRHVFINQPAYRAAYLEGGKERLSMRAIVGKPSNQTSFFYDEIETVVYNPYWGVPRSIIVNEMLPKLRANPAYLDERGYELTNSKGQRVASSNVDWSQVGSNPRYDVRQPPGARNALGELKILFPNKHAIYMHDTPSRHLFKQSKRALSHGCVRLQKPRDMAAAVLGTSTDYIGSKISAGHGKESVPGKIPVYVSYFTAWPKDDGSVGYYPDIYGRDRNLSKALSITNRARDELTVS